MTTKIPDDVVERVKEILRLFHRDSCYPDAMDFELDEAARAALEMAVAWERERIETIIAELRPEDDDLWNAIRARRALEKE